jgi:hypothetical protein
MFTTHNRHVTTHSRGSIHVQTPPHLPCQDKMLTRGGNTKQPHVTQLAPKPLPPNSNGLFIDSDQNIVVARVVAHIQMPGRSVSKAFSTRAAACGKVFAWDQLGYLIKPATKQLHALANTLHCLTKPPGQWHCERHPAILAFGHVGKYQVQVSTYADNSRSSHLLLDLRRLFSTATS